jgi:beclin 1
MDPTFMIPYEIDKEKIGGAGIKTNFNNDVVWTKALKHTLINLKWLLAWTTKHDDKT